MAQPALAFAAPAAAQRITGLPHASLAEPAAEPAERGAGQAGVALRGWRRGPRVDERAQERQLRSGIANYATMKKNSLFGGNGAKNTVFPKKKNKKRLLESTFF